MKRRRYRGFPWTPRPVGLIHVLLLVSTPCFRLAATTTPDDQAPHCGAPDAGTYEWEKYDFYRILGLNGGDNDDDGQDYLSMPRKKRRQKRAQIDGKAIRKAYRKQAQLYHPDKNKNGTVDESNARFARIAEAYEVLNDESKRQDYDYWLLDCEEYMRRLSSSNAGRRKEQNAQEAWHQEMGETRDPRDVFEDFFFGSSSSGDGWDDMGARNGRRASQEPIRVSESRETLYDPNTRTEILRIYTKEDYAPTREGSFLYRVYVQDFVEQFDRYRGGWTYLPISQPTLIEEGYEEDSNFGSTRQSQDVLSAYEFVTIDSPALRSPNGRYSAGITPDCELIVLKEPNRGDDEQKVIWSSDTFVPQSLLYEYGGCFLSLRGPHLVLALGHPNSPGNILWHSDVPDKIVDDEEKLQEAGGPMPIYFAKLDNDGSLVVYSRRRIPMKKGRSNEDEPVNTTPRKRWFSDLLHRMDTTPKTRAAKAWTSVRDWTLSKFSSKSGSIAPMVRDVCLFATGPAGCNSGARRILHVAKDINNSFQSVSQAFLETLEGSDEDDDVLDTLFRVVGKASGAVGRVGRKIVVSSMKKVYRTVRKVAVDSSRRLSPHDT